MKDWAMRRFADETRESLSNSGDPYCLDGQHIAYCVEQSVYVSQLPRERPGTTHTRTLDDGLIPIEGLKFSSRRLATRLPRIAAHGRALPASGVSSQVYQPWSRGDGQPLALAARQCAYPRTQPPNLGADFTCASR